MKPFNYITMLLLATTLISNYSFSQEWNWVDSKVSGSKGGYNCSKHKTINEAIYVNQKYNLKEMLKEYPGYATVDPSFLGYKTDLHDIFLKAIKMSIDEKKIKTLAEKNEQFYVGFDLDQDGNILMLYFTLDTATIVATEELFNLEENIKKFFVFKPIRKVNVKLSGGFGITTNFKEILAGEIPYIRKMEEQQRKTERLFGN